MISFNRILAMLSSFKQTVFAVLFLTSETLHDAPKDTRSKLFSVLLMVIDFLQVLRLMMPAAVGWDQQSSAAIAKIDVVHLALSYLSPSGINAASACALLLVLAGICNTAYLFSQIKTDNLDNVLPFRILRVIITIIVTSLFPTVLEFCLKPLSCSFWSGTMPCTLSPFSWPQILLAIISIVLSSILILVSFVFSLLCVDMDLLSQEPLAAFQGRTSALYNLLQIALVLIPIVFSSGVYPILAIIIFLYTANISFLTIHILPYMFQLTNYIKAFISFTLTYLSLLGVFASFGYDQSQLVVAIYAGCPVFAILGIVAVYCRCVMLVATAEKSLSMLPSELAPDMPSVASVAHSAIASEAGQASRWTAARKVVSSSNFHSDAPLELKFSVINKVNRYMQEHSESQFYSTQDVLAAAKVLLWQRQRASVPKIKQLLRASMIQHGQNDWTSVFSICFVYCIEEDMNRVAGLLESSKLMNFGIECQYLKFSISRRLIQRFQSSGSSHAGGMMSAIGLLEVTSVQDETNKLYRQCLQTLRSFWNAAAQERDVETLSGYLEDFFVLFQQADFVMKDMLIKYPNSVVFLRSYGVFMRDICQDKMKSSELFNKADNLENASDGPDDVGGSKSLSSSTFRAAAANAWTQHALQKDIDMMGDVSKSMRNTLALLVVVSTLVYCVLEFVLLQSVSGHISDIYSLNSARSECETAMYSARDAVLAAFENESSSFSAAMAQLISSANNLKTYISESSFNEDTYSFFFFSKYVVLRPQFMSISLPDEVSPASGLQQFADACLFFASTRMSDVSSMIKNNDFSSSAGFALRFLLSNGDSPVMPSLDKGGMLLQGQAVSFVYLSGVFYVVAGLVVVLLGLHMVVLTRRLLSEAIVLLRTSTICISAALHISQISRKSLSAHYKNLDQEAIHMTGEGGIEADGHDPLNVPADADEYDDDSASVAGSLDRNPVAHAHADRTRFQAQKIEDNFLNPGEKDKEVVSFPDSTAVVEESIEAADPISNFHTMDSIESQNDFPKSMLSSESFAATDNPPSMPARMIISQQEDKKTLGASFATETHQIPSNAFSSPSHSVASSEDVSVQSSQKNVRDQKMMVIISLCIFAVVIFNIATYIYLEPVKIGSVNFMNLRKLLDIQANIDLPMARVLPTLLHIAQLANPHLDGQPRMTQMEHLNVLKFDFKTALEYWQTEYSDTPKLAESLQHQLFLGHSMFNYFSSYTIPYLETRQYDRAKCDMFVSLIDIEKKFLDSSNEAIDDIEAISVDLDNVLSQESRNLPIVVFTSLSVLVLVLLVFGCFIVTDSQRIRVSSMWHAMTKKWNRIAHRNRVYDIGDLAHNAETRLGVNDKRTKTLSRNFESCAAGFMIVFMLGLLVNAVLLHTLVVPSLIMGGPAFDHFESAAEFLASEMTPKLFLLDVFSYISYGLYGFQCNSSANPFFGLSSPQKYVDIVNSKFEEFNSEHAIWSLQIDDFPELKSGLEELHASGIPIADTFRDRIVPLVLQGNFATAMQLTETVLTDQFAVHESIAAEVSLIIDLFYSNTLSLASYGRDTSLWFIYGISGMLFAAVAFISALLIRDASHYKLELSDVASDPTSALNHVIPKLTHVHEKNQAAMSERSMMVVFALVTFIQILGIVLPIRYLGGLAQQSPVANQVGRLDVLLVRDAYATRELFVNDDLSAIFMAGDLSPAALDRNNRNLLLAMNVLRYGGNWGISTGRRGEADILSLWESSQCLIKDSNAAKKCSDSSRPLHESRMHGLSLLLMNIYSSVGQVKHLLKILPNNASAAERIQFVHHVPELAFVDSNIHDDARQGIATLSAMEAKSTIMQSMLSELRILFGLNVAVSVIVLYYATFLRTVGNVVQQARLSRIFLSTIPLEAMTKAQAEHLRSLFFPESQEDY